MSKSKHSRNNQKQNRHAAYSDENREERKMQHHRKNQPGPWEEEEGETPDAPSGLSGMPEPNGGPVPR